MTQVNNKMITLARESRGYSQRELSQLLKVSQGKLSKVEQGTLSVSDDMLEKMENFLNYPKKFFYEPENIYPPITPFHRKRKRLSKKAQNFIEAKANIYRIHISKMQQSAELDQDIIFCDLDDYGGQPENIANVLRRYWKLPKGPIDNLTNVVEQAGIVVIFFDFQTNLLDGFTFVTPKSFPIIFLNSKFPGDRLRFTLAHELGHIVMHHVPTITAEDEANRFASEFLMPSEEIKPQLKRLTLAKLANLKPYWKVSMAALLVKAGKKGLNLLTYNQERYLWRQMAPYRTVEPLKLDIPQEQPSLWKELNEFHLTELGYNEKELCDLLNLFPQEYPNYYPFHHKFTKKHLRIV